jgi:hypothetical protein
MTASSIFDQIPMTFIEHRVGPAHKSGFNQQLDENSKMYIFIKMMKRDLTPTPIAAQR